MENNVIPGKNKAIASLVLGIIAIVCWFFGVGAVISVICGIVGLVLAGKAKEEGFITGLRTAGFVCSLIGLIGGGIVLLIAIMLGGLIGSALIFAM